MKDEHEILFSHNLQRSRHKLNSPITILLNIKRFRQKNDIIEIEFY